MSNHPIQTLFIRAETRTVMQRATGTQLAVNIPNSFCTHPHLNLSILDNYLKPDSRWQVGDTSNSAFLLIPLLETVVLDPAEQQLVPGSVYITTSQDVQSLSYYNPQLSSWSRWLEIRCKVLASCQATKIDIPRWHNTLHLLLETPHFSLWMGQFDGRFEAHLPTNQADVWVMVLHGAFECNNRLLEKDDGLWMQGCEAVSFEALSERAVIWIATFASIDRTI